MKHAAFTRIATTVAGAALVFGLGAAIIGADVRAGSAVVAAESNPWNGAAEDSNPWNGTQDDSNPWNAAPASSNPWN
ncbi:hypothetical protein GCM10011609_10660 [Lentzea pudingi]|uniref:Uncharacterized protein n=1 Tax=Lentzea pudingi TaxID=1789439 RepID=A0ABQ2HD30_9PSEU|nr:hypothetical protein [Lentzea pudingi]GGM76621.1 hypothetical protein GCM10011609_10660 [Lentzea pudingi]